MSITYVGERRAGASVAPNGTLSTERVFVFHFNGGDSPVAVLAMPQVPAQGAAHPDNAQLKAGAISCSPPQEGDGVASGRYDVTVSYIMPEGGYEGRDRTTPPWQMPPYDIAKSGKEYIVPFVKAYADGNQHGTPTVPVVNSAGDPYEDSVPRYNSILRFSFNLRDFNEEWPVKYIDSINAAAAKIVDVTIPARRGRIASLGGSKLEIFDAEGALQYEYWRVDVEIEIAAEEWKKEILCRGLFAIDGDGKYRIYMRKDDASGAVFGRVEDLGEEPVPCDEPQLLSATTGAMISSAGTGTAEYQEFKDKFATSWSPLNFPTSTRRR